MFREEHYNNNRLLTSPSDLQAMAASLTVNYNSRSICEYSVVA